MDDIKAAVAGELDRAMFEGGRAVLESAESKAPRMTGDLSESGYVSTKTYTSYQGGKGKRKEVTAPKGGAAVGFSNFKALWHEMGTQKMAARPFLRPAMDERKTAATDKIVMVLRGAIQE